MTGATGTGLSTICLDGSLRRISEGKACDWKLFCREMGLLVRLLVAFLSF